MSNTRDASQSDDDDGALNKEGKFKSRQTAPVPPLPTTSLLINSTVTAPSPHLDIYSGTAVPLKTPSRVSPHFTPAICVPQAVAGYKGG